MTLEPRDVEAIAERVAALVREDVAPFPSRGLVDAERVATFLGVDREWVYAHKCDLGAVRIGHGRGVLRFEASQVVAYVRGGRLVARPEPPRARPGPRGRDDHVELLPVPRRVR